MKPHLLAALSVSMASAVLGALAATDFAARGLHWFAAISATASVAAFICIVLLAVVMLRKPHA